MYQYSDDDIREEWIGVVKAIVAMVTGVAIASTVLWVMLWYVISTMEGM